MTNPWLEFVERWKDCQQCPLAQQRSNICLARGDLPCDVLFIGQGPGPSEDARGIPFDGPAGKLLDGIIARAFAGMTVRHALTNLVCCFPRDNKLEGNEDPDRADILSCRPRLIEFINIAQPRLIVCVGSLAASYVSHMDTVPCIDITHPAAILRREVPQAQKQMMVQRCVVQIRSAVEDMLQSNSTFTRWGDRYAAVKTEKDYLGIDFAAAAARKRQQPTAASDDDIPF